jgi:hypothetical protein
MADSGLHRSSTFGERLTGALRLKPETFEEVEHDRGALGQALVVVTLGSLATGIGAIGVPRTGTALLTGVVFTLTGWLVWAAIIYLVGTRLLAQPQTQSDIGELLRTTGFAAAPGLFGIVGIIGVLGAFLQFLITLWMLAAMLIAVRQALDFTSVWRAVGVVALGYIPYLALVFLAAALART